MNSYITQVETGAFARVEAATPKNAAELAVFREGTRSHKVRVHVRGGDSSATYLVKRSSPACVSVARVKVGPKIALDGVRWVHEGDGQWVGRVEGLSDSKLPRVSIRVLPDGDNCVTSRGPVSLHCLAKLTAIDAAWRDGTYTGELDG